MTGFIRSFVFLLIGILVASTLALSTAPLKAEASDTMMPMALAGQDCKTCDPRMDMMASCDLTCALSMAGVLVVPVNYAAVSSDCSFEFANAIASGRAPPPAFTPPRTILLI